MRWEEQSSRSILGKDSELGQEVEEGLWSHEVWACENQQFCAHWVSITSVISSEFPFRIPTKPRMEKQYANIKTLKHFPQWGAWLAQLEKHVTPDLGVLIPSPTQGIETNLNK